MAQQLPYRVPHIFFYQFKGFLKKTIGPKYA